jgi:hypothetical protein
LLVLGLTACGSTALRGGSAPAGVAGLDTANGTTTGGDVTAAPGVGTTEGTSTGGTTTAGGAQGAFGTSGATSGTTSGAAVSTTGTGETPGSRVPATTTKKPLRVGVFGVDVTAIYAVFGKSEDAPDDFYAPYRAMAKYINDHGGVGGRQMVLLTHTADSAGDANTEGQKACAAFTQDNKVDIVYDYAGSPVLAACLQKAGITSVGGGNYAMDGVETNTYLNWLMPASMRIDRLMRSLLEVSSARGTLKRGDKLGVMVDSCPYGPRVYNNVIVPFAKKLGVGVVQSSITCVDNLVEDLGPVTNDVQRAALSFSSSGVTHVIGLHGAEAFIIANFTTNASQQRYFPKYLVTSNAYAWQNSQSDAVIKISPDAVPHMSGVGFLPFFDVGPHAQFGAAQKQAQAVCTKADPSQFGAAAKNDNGKWFALNTFYSQCSAFFLIKDVIEAAGMRLDPHSLLEAFSVLKSRAAVSAVFNNGRLGGPAGSTDGSGFVQAFVYDKQKTFVYAGSPIPVSS